jgi:peptidoglycan/xylan/chitin deacetylase (PgdA/CDA1 family)
VTVRPPLVLMYHGVGERPRARDPHHLFVPPARLRAQLSFLLERGWRPLRLAEYLDGGVDGPSFLVTFDDGYRCLLDLGLPLLSDLGVPATVFVLPGRFGQHADWMPGAVREPLLRAAEVLRLRDGGLDIGLHGWSHRSLAGLSVGQVRLQTEAAADELARLTGERPAAFAYPYGHHDAAARQAVAATEGMRVAFATHDAAGCWALPRVDINSTDNAATFRLKTSPGYPQLRRSAGRVAGLRPAVRVLLGGVDRRPGR